MAVRANSTKFMFWNVGRKSLGPLIASAAQKHELDIILLAECNDSNTILLALNTSNPRPYLHSRQEAGRVDIFSRLPHSSLKVLGDYGGLSFWHLTPPIGRDSLLVAAHLPSKRHMSAQDQTLHCTRLIGKLGEFEQKLGHKRTMVVGDFNINPFEHGLIAAECFHASLSRTIAKRKTRTVQHNTYTFFYNPMWNHFGDRRPGPPGTYFYDASTSTNMYWQMFDQVLIRPDLLDYFQDESIQILSDISGIPLTRPDGRPDFTVGSDHFPVLFALNIVEDTNDS